MSVSENKNTDTGRKEGFIWRTKRFFLFPLHSFAGLFSTNKTFVEQVFFVIAAFATMVLVSDLFINKIITDQMDAQSRSILASTYHYVGATFSNLETMVINFSAEVELAVAEGRSIEDIHEYLKIASDQLGIFKGAGADGHFFRKGRFYNELEYTGFYCELFGQLIDGVDWEAPEEYDVRKRQWYTDIKNGQGELVYSGPSFSKRNEEFVVYLGKALYMTDNEEQKFIGVLAISIEVKNIIKLIKSLREPSSEYTSSESKDYVVLVNPQRHIVAHHDSELIGKFLADVSAGGAQIMEDIRDIKEAGTFPRSFFKNNAEDVQCVYYYGLLKNDWLVISLIPVEDYYYRGKLVAAILIILGMIMAGILCFFLARLYHEKQEADLRSQSKSMFLARMSHEIRTPMNVIAGLSRLIAQEKKQLPPKILKYSVEIHHAANNLLAIINDILDLSKVEAGKMEIVKVSFTLSSLLDDVISIIHTRILDKGLQFISFVDTQLPNNLIGDVVHIRQILLNILGNAAKYTRKGHVAFDILGEKIDEKTIMITFMIRDTGIGIRNEDQSKIFTDFSQVGIESNWNIEGTGLGLSITKELVTRLGGSISMISQHGQGSIFTINLPVEMENEQPCAIVRDALAHHILIYEPRQVYEQSLIRALEHLNISYEQVQNVSAFSEALQNNRKISFIFVASFIYDDISKFLESALFSNIQIILLCESHDQYRLSQVRSVMLPINPLHIASLLNNGFGNMEERSDIRMFFKMPTTRILVVDDNQPNLLVIEGLLAPYECQIDFVTSGKEALQCIQKFHYDLIFMDHMMPEMDGIETTNHIRELSKKKDDNQYYWTVPIVALTANAVFGMKEVFLQNGMNDFLPKPIDPVHLNEVLATWIPKEKQQPVDSQIWGSKPADEELILIRGINTRVGIIQTGGTLEGYIRVIGSLCSELETKVRAMNKALETNDLAMYKMYVHSYKSFLATIGVMPLSVTAAMLEIAAQNEDRATIDIHHENFIQDLREIAKAVTTTLNAKNKKIDNIVISAADKNLLHTELIQLKSAIAEMQIQQIDLIMESLLEKHWTKDIIEHLEKIMRCITLFEWSEAVEYIDQLQEMD